ncbi:MAG TPA: GNAT family N-acetyltransferase [Pyrinomonadaceae bacterium]|nr:GNAT family N-acetyltransferase [Pyrinomonadaceae bacterium]
MGTTIKTDVVIVGAGPTGLSLACQFVRYGVDFRIVEKNEAVTPYSKAIGVQARTLEIYEQIGLGLEAVERGTIAQKGRLIVGGEVRGEIEFSNIGEGLSPYPFVLMLEQSKNERLLYEYLQSHGKDVLWKTELENLSQTEAGVKAQVKLAGGASQAIEAKYLAACDGAKSPVRHALGLEFAGSTFERMFYVADVQVDWNFGHDALNICLSKETFVVFFPLKGEKRYRIVGVFPEEFAKDEGEVLYEEIEARVRGEVKLELDIHDVEWFSTYKVHTRHVNKFSEERCFLAGDAAHIHSPAGAQGMNTGIQDGYNLAWKLALVLTGRAGEKLLATYNEERLENAKHLLKTTDRMFQFAASPEWFIEFLRTSVFPHVANFVLGLDTFKQFFFPLISQIGINYRRGSLSRHDGDGAFEVKAGDRMPYFLMDGESIYDRLRQPKFHLLVFSDSQDSVQALRTELGSRYADLVDFDAMLLNRQVVEAFGTDKPFHVLLRPDNHIGFISAGASPDGLGDYLNDSLGVSVLKVLETDRLILRRLSTDDAEFILRLVNEPSWLRFIGDRGVRSVADARAYILNGPLEMYSRLGFGLYLVELKEEGVSIGLCGLIKRDTLEDVDIGFAFLPEYWGRGYAFEAASAVMAYGRDALGIKRIVAITSADNDSSARLLEKLGFRFERMIKFSVDSEEVKLFNSNL